MSNKKELILLIETAAQLCSVSICDNISVIDTNISRTPRTHASIISLLTKELLSKLSLTPSNLSAVAISEGPGSYTGLRVGLSFAKGLCFALNIPLISVGTLDILATLAIEKIEESYNIKESEVVIIPMIDAKRMEVYTALYNLEGERISQVEPLIVEEDSFAALSKEAALFFCGDGSTKVAEVIKNPNSHFLDIELLSNGMAKIAIEKFKNSEFQDVAYFEPLYLKEFIAGKPKRDLLRP